MPAAWEEDEPSEPTWSDPDAWRGAGYHLEPAWSPEPNTLWGMPPGDEPFIIEEALLEDDEDWIPGGWLEDWDEEG
jgi:hypothetical protein